MVCNTLDKWPVSYMRRLGTTNWPIPSGKLVTIQSPASKLPWTLTITPGRMIKHQQKQQWWHWYINRTIKFVTWSNSRCYGRYFNHKSTYQTPHGGTRTNHDDEPYQSHCLNARHTKPNPTEWSTWCPSTLCQCHYHNSSNCLNIAAVLPATWQRNWQRWWQ